MAFFPSDEDQSHQTPLFSHCFKVTTRIFYWLDRRHSMGSPVNNWLVSTAPLCMTPCPEPGHLKWPVVNQICSLWRVKNGEFMRVALCFTNNVCFKMTNGQTDECLSWRQRAASDLMTFWPFLGSPLCQVIFKSYDTPSSYPTLNSPWYIYFLKSNLLSFFLTMCIHLLSACKYKAFFDKLW